MHYDVRCPSQKARMMDDVGTKSYVTVQRRGTRAGLQMSTEVADVINTFRMLAELPPDSLGAYVISMARSASDVLAVVLLQRECGVKVRPTRAPLWESQGRRAPDVPPCGSTHTPCTGCAPRGFRRARRTTCGWLPSLSRWTTWTTRRRP